MGEDDHGFDMVVYVSRPCVFVSYAPSMVCVGQITAVPADLVFATYVKLDRDKGAMNRGRLQAISGVVTHWQFLEADDRDLMLPAAFEERYRRQLW